MFALSVVFATTSGPAGAGVSVVLLVGGSSAAMGTSGSHRRPAAKQMVCVCVDYRTVRRKKKANVWY